MEKVLGKALRKERESRGVSLQEIADETRIGLRFLKALEEEDFQAFAGKFYVYYYMKNYLRACGADETAFLNTYRTYLDATLKSGSELSPQEYMHKMAYSKFKRRRWMMIVATALLLLALAVYMLLAQPHWLQRLEPAGNRRAVAIPPFSDYLLRPAEESCLTGPPLSARMEFDSPCWLQLWRGDEKVAERVFRPGESQLLQGYRLTLVVDRPQALRLQINGRDVAMLRRATSALRLSVDPGSLAALLQR